MKTKEIQPKTQKHKLTKKQKGFVNDYSIDENGTKAALNNYNTDKSVVAANIASENLTKPYIVEAIEDNRMSLREALIEQGITEKRIAEKIDVLLNATSQEGQPDFTAVDKGLKHATAIYGIIPDGPKVNQSVTYNFLFSKETQDQIAIINKTIKDKLINVQPN